MTMWPHFKKAPSLPALDCFSLDKLWGPLSLHGCPQQQQPQCLQRAPGSSVEARAENTAHHYILGET